MLILWLARAAGASTDAATEDYWRHFGFRASLTKRTDADGQQRQRLWSPLFSEI